MTHIVSPRMNWHVLETYAEDGSLENQPLVLRLMNLAITDYGHEPMSQGDTL
jgi:hypothetical protein